MKMSEERFQEILDRAEEGDALNEHEILETLETIFDIPLEHLELQLAKIRGEKLITVDEVLLEFPI